MSQQGAGGQPWCQAEAGVETVSQAGRQGAGFGVGPAQRERKGSCELGGRVHGGRGGESGPGERLCRRGAAGAYAGRRLVSGLITRGIIGHTATHTNVNVYVRTGWSWTGQRPLVKGGRRGQVEIRAGKLLPAGGVSGWQSVYNSGSWAAPDALPCVLAWTRLFSRSDVTRAVLHRGVSGVERSDSSPGVMTLHSVCSCS